MSTPEETLAQWRRAGHGVWRFTFVVDGYDDRFIHLVPGNLTQVIAEGLAKHHCALELRTKRHFVYTVDWELDK
jgi:hypothetical protein